MLISHPAEKNVPEKKLIDHLSNVASISTESLKKMSLNLSEELISKRNLIKLSEIIGVLHDFGKATTYFQDYIKKEKKGSNLKNHALLSAIITYYVVKDVFKNERNVELYAMIAYLIVKRHHGNLETLKELRNETQILVTQLKSIKESDIKGLHNFYQKYGIDLKTILQSVNFEEFVEQSEDFEFFFDEVEYDDDLKIELFFLTNLLFSLLIDADKKDAARLKDEDYFKDNLNEENNDIFEFLQKKRKDNPDKFSVDIPINKIRNEFLNEIVNNKKIDTKNHFYTISAPTGIGKTFGCLAFANRLKELLPKDQGRIIYALPYTSIIDQNYEEFKSIIKFNKKELFDLRPTRYLLKHHHLSLKKIENRVPNESYNYKNYLDDKLFVESWESSMIVTTFVQFFHTVIGGRNRFLKKFHNIVNSIVILDEVQNINPEYYSLLKRTLTVLGEKFNTYFLLITATQPEILDREKVVDVVDSKKYMEHELFNRVKLIYNKQITTVDAFQKWFVETFDKENALIVVNTKKTAINLAKIFKGMESYTVYSLTTFLTPRDRKEKIKNIKENLKNGKRIIVVATQLIEAGVDISFKYVYRNLAPFDSIVQVAGRCNRNGEYGVLGGITTLYSFEDDKFVYNKILKTYVKEILLNDVYESREFYEISLNYFNKFDFNVKSRMFIDSLLKLNYDDESDNSIKPIKDFKLIEEYDSENIFILTTQKADDLMEELLNSTHQLISKGLDGKEKSNLLMRIETLKTKLKEFEISLKAYELSNYSNLIIIEECGYFKYISYENQKKYAYDENFGFVIEPKEYAGTMCL